VIKLSKKEDERARELQEKLLKIDLHCHGVIYFPYTFLPHLPLSPPSPPDMPYFPDGNILPLPKEVLQYLGALRNVPLETYMKSYRINWEGLREARLTGMSHILGAAIAEDFQRCIYHLAFAFANISKNPLGKRAYCAEDFRAAHREGKIAFMAATESNPIGNILERVEMMYGLGFRQMGMTYAHSNYAGGGESDTKEIGLTDWGMDIIKKMNELGMIIDVSHSGMRTSMDVVETSRDPITFSHNAATGAYPEGKRCRTDEQLKALADKKGVIGISSVPNNLSEAPRQGVKDWFNHADYIVKLIGTDHVAVGLDSNYVDHTAMHKVMFPEKPLPTDYMEGMENPTEAWHNIIRCLVLEGYSDQEIGKVAGENALRLIERVVG